MSSFPPATMRPFQERGPVREPRPPVLAAWRSGGHLRFFCLLLLAGFARHTVQRHAHGEEDFGTHVASIVRVRTAVGRRETTAIALRALRRSRCALLRPSRGE
jgi:hypothetical protein